MWIIFSFTVILSIGNNLAKERSDQNVLISRERLKEVRQWLGFDSSESKLPIFLQGGGRVRPKNSDDHRVGGIYDSLGYMAPLLKLLSYLDGAEYDYRGNRIRTKKNNRYGRPRYWFDVPLSFVFPNLTYFVFSRFLIWIFNNKKGHFIIFHNL